MARIDVEPEEWSDFRIEALRTKPTVGDYLGHLVANEVDPTPRRDDRRHGRDESRPPKQERRPPLPAMTKRRGPITAAELMAELKEDPGYQTFLEDVEQRKEFNRESYRREAAGVLEDLADAGFEVETVGELVHRRIRYPDAIPVLLRWLPRVKDRFVKEDIVRTLSVPWAGPDAIRPLLEEFHKTATAEGGIAWVIGSALEVIADDSVFDEVAAIATDKNYGRSREMLVAALGNMKNAQAREILIELLDDDEVAGYAVMGLGKLKAREAKGKIEPFLEHPQEWVRKEAKKALAKIG